MELLAKAFSAIGSDRRIRVNHSDHVEGMSRRTKQLLVAYDLGLAALDGGDRVKVSYYKANVLEDWERYDEAVKLYIDIIDHAPRSELAESAAERVLYVEEIDAGHGQLAERLYADKAFLAHRPRLAKMVGERHRTTLIHRANVLEIGDDFRGCARAFLAIYDADPKANDAADLLWNAAHCYVLDHDGANAKRTVARLAARFPDSLLLERARAELDP
jgi:tetratricopeptide (TPR) repeat protein